MKKKRMFLTTIIFMLFLGITGVTAKTYTWKYDLELPEGIIAPTVKTIKVTADYETKKLSWKFDKFKAKLQKDIDKKWFNNVKEGKGSSITVCFPIKNGTVTGAGSMTSIDTTEYVYITFESADEDIDGGDGVKRTCYSYKPTLVSSNEIEEETHEVKSCVGLGKSECKGNKDYACMWVEEDGYSYCNTDNLRYVTCGDTKNIPYQVPEIISFAVNFLKIMTPIILIFLSIISLVKALASSKEDEIKKAQSSLIKKTIAAVMVFFVISIVQFVVKKVADDDEVGNIDDCLNCFLDNECGESLYYITNVAGQEIKTYLKGSEKD